MTAVVSTALNANDDVSNTTAPNTVKVDSKTTMPPEQQQQRQEHQETASPKGLNESLDENWEKLGSPERKSITSNTSQQTATINSPNKTKKMNDNKSDNNNKHDDDDYHYPTRYSPLQKEDPDQAMVITLYGPGLVVRTRKHPTTHKVVSRDIELTNWRTATPKRGPARPAMLYTATQFPSAPVEVGSHVMTQYGRGRVLELRQTTETKTDTGSMAVVQLSNWRLAGKSRVTCFLPASQLQVVRPKKLYEMNVFERVEYAQHLKGEARDLFASKQYDKALQKYALAVDAVRYVQHNAASTNQVRADLLVVMMTCCNNAATCEAQMTSSSVKPKKDDNNNNKTNSNNKSTNLHWSNVNWSSVQKYATNALVLVDALQEKQQGDSTSRVMKILERDGFSATKIFGEWKGKSLLLLAKAETEKQNYDAALQLCRRFHDQIMAKYSDSKIVQHHDKEFQRLQHLCQQRKKMVLKKEKQRAQAMFGGGVGSSNKSPATKTANGTTTGSEKAINGKATTTQRDTKDSSTTPETDDEDPVATPKKRVSFLGGDKPSDDYNPQDKARAVLDSSDDYDNFGNDGDDDDGEASEVPWYQEHQELLILTGAVAGIAGVAYTLLGGRKR